MCEPGIEPDRVLDNLGRKTMALEGKWDHTTTVPVADSSRHRLNVSMSSCDLAIRQTDRDGRSFPDRAGDVERAVH